MSRQLMLKTAIIIVLVAALGGATGCEALTSPDDPLWDDRDIECTSATVADGCPAVNR